MEFIPYRDLRNEPSAVRRKLVDQGELIVTVDGKPFAVMIDVSQNENIEDTLVMVSRMRAQMAARSIRSQAKRVGLERIKNKEIEKIIDIVRGK